MQLVRPAVAVVAVALLTAGTAAATSLGGLTSRSLGAGGAAIGRCDTAVGAAFTTNASGQVTHVTLDGVAAACNGSTLLVALVDTTGARKAGGSASGISVPAGGGSVTVAVDPLLSGSSYANVRVAFLGR